MKKIFFVLALILISNAHARTSGPGGGWGREIDKESFGFGGSGRFTSRTFEGSGAGRLAWLNSVEGNSEMESTMEYSNTEEDSFPMEYSGEFGAGDI